MRDHNVTSPSDRYMYGSMSSASTAEILVPPLAILGAGYIGLLLLWLKTHGGCIARALLPGRLLTKSSVDIADTQREDKIRITPLLTEEDRKVLRSIRENTNTFKEILKIIFPATLSLAFCPLTLFTHKFIVQGLWPPSMHPTAPNVNDGIACFLVPAGMVYAISFGFAFQAVFSRHQDADRCVSDEVNRLNRVISLVCRIQFPCHHTRLSVLRTIKDDIISLIQDIFETRNAQHYDTEKEAFQDIILCLSTSSPMPSSTESVLRKELIKLISFQVYKLELKCPHAQRIHPLMWAFLETLGYFNFLAMLLVQTQSYRMDLSMCIITVISISMLCYIVADLDSPFHGFFRANLNVLPSLIGRLDVIYRNYIINMSNDVKM